MHFLINYKFDRYRISISNQISMSMSALIINIKICCTTHTKSSQHFHEQHLHCEMKKGKAKGPSSSTRDFEISQTKHRAIFINVFQGFHWLLLRSIYAIRGTRVLFVRGGLSRFSIPRGTILPPSRLSHTQKYLIPSGRSWKHLTKATSWVK